MALTLHGGPPAVTVFWSTDLNIDRLISTLSNMTAHVQQMLVTEQIQSLICHQKQFCFVKTSAFCRYTDM